MNLSFDFDEIKTSVIYADDDPEYMTGRRVDKQKCELTERQRELRRQFLGIICRVRQYNIPVNVDNLIEAVRDYFREREEEIA